MRCEKCGTENLGGSGYCKECGAPLVPEATEAEKAETEEAAKQKPAAVEPGSEKVVEEESELKSAEGEPTLFARSIGIIWDRKGPILMALFTVLMMSMVFAPWVFLRLDILGFEIVSNSYTGWAIYVPRILFYLSIVPLIFSLLMIAGIGTRRRVIETHICTFVGGVIFTVWLVIFSLSEVLSSIIRNVKVLEIGVSGGQVATIVLFVGFMFGIIVTTYDRGRRLEEAGARH